MLNFGHVIIDLGTGDGRFVYKHALKNPQNLYIGIDPSEKQLQTYKKKINRKKLKNALFFAGSLEVLPKDFNYIANELHIVLPWGSLLMYIVKPEKEMIEKLSGLIKLGGTLVVVLGYSDKFEPKEVARLEIPEIDETLIDNTISLKFEEFGRLELKQRSTLKLNELKEIESTWSKKLSFGKNRPIYKLVFVKH
ncbi:class I SAM-dependent methyltransferase [Patescibacteria group bacterium]|nr:class I SAM-dependent methyltransferase [Patescibacteria group bacterium]